MWPHNSKTLKKIIAWIKQTIYWNRHIHAQGVQEYVQIPMVQWKKYYN